MRNKILMTATLSLLLASTVVFTQETSKADDLTSAAECDCTLMELQISTKGDQHRDVTTRTSQHKQRLMVEIEQRKCSEKLRHVEAEIDKLRDQLRSQRQSRLQLEVDVRKEVLRDTAQSATLVQTLTRENIELKQQLKEAQTFTIDILEMLRKSKSEFLTAVEIQSNKVISVQNSSLTQTEAKIIENLQKLDDKVDKALLSQNHLEEVSVNCKLQGDMLSQVVSSLEKCDKQLTTTSQPELACQTPDLPTTTLNGKQYYFSHDQPQMSWSDAFDFCKRHHMDLVSVETQQEWDALKPHLNKLRNKAGYWPWSAGSDIVEEGQWRWMTTGSEVTFFERRYHNTDNKGEDCLLLYTEFWNDYPCSHKLSFICQVNSAC